MSGTSLDGVDLAYINITADPKFSYKFLVSETISYSKGWNKKLRNATFLSEKQLHELNEDYTRSLAKWINNFIQKYKIQQLDAVCSHGHTILHQPKKGVTLQIGNLPLLKDYITATIVCDFRVQDVQLGGQGAPLVPIGDQLFFSEYDSCLNLGGFANCSFESSVGERIAYDICPVNVVLNHYALKLGKAYDDSGAFAKAGTVQPQLLEQLNALDYYKTAAPKSLGIEWVNKMVFPIIEAYTFDAKDILATCTEHIAKQLAEAFMSDSKVLVTGGGAYNAYLLECVKAHKNIELVVPENQLVEYKEALIFGLLGVLRLRNEVNCLASVTGAKKSHSSGVIFS